MNAYVTCWHAAVTTTLSTIGDSQLSEPRNQRFPESFHVIFVHGYTSFLDPWFWDQAQQGYPERPLYSLHRKVFIVSAELTTYPTLRCDCIGEVTTARPTKAFHMAAFLLTADSSRCPLQNYDGGLFDYNPSQIKPYRATSGRRPQANNDRLAFCTSGRIATWKRSCKLTSD